MEEKRYRYITVDIAEDDAASSDVLDHQLSEDQMNQDAHQQADDVPFAGMRKGVLIALGIFVVLFAVYYAVGL